MADWSPVMARIRRVVSTPSMSGIFQSTSMRLYGSRRAWRSCTISTAKKDVNNQSVDGVQTRFIVFLQKRADTGEEAAAEGENPSSLISNFGAVTQFIGGEVSQSEGSEP